MVSSRGCCSASEAPTFRAAKATSSERRVTPALAVRLVLSNLSAPPGSAEILSVVAPAAGVVADVCV